MEFIIEIALISFAVGIIAIVIAIITNTETSVKKLRKPIKQAYTRRELEEQRDKLAAEIRKLRVAEDKAIPQNYKYSSRGNYSYTLYKNPILSSTSNNGITLEKVPDTPKWDNEDQMISGQVSDSYTPYSDSDSFGHGGDFGGGGTRGSWDSPSDNSSYDSGSSDSSSYNE